MTIVDEDRDQAWAERLAVIVEQTRARREARARARQELQEARNWGLAARHKAKLARAAQRQPRDDTQPGR